MNCCYKNAFKGRTRWCGKALFTPSVNVTVNIKNATLMGKNGYATHSAHHSDRQIDQRWPPVNVDADVTESLGVDEPSLQRQRSTSNRVTIDLNRNIVSRCQLGWYCPRIIVCVVLYFSCLLILKQISNIFIPNVVQMMKCVCPSNKIHMELRYVCTW